MKCPSCKHKNASELLYCEQCGCLLPDKAAKKKKKKWKLILIIVLITVCLIGMFYFNGLVGRMITSVTSGTSLESAESRMIEEHFQNGVSLMEDGYYLRAVSELMLVPKDHWRYSESKKYIAESYNQFADYLDTMISDCKNEDDFQEIYNVLTSVDTSLLDDSFELDSKISALQNQYESYLTQKLDLYESQGDLVSALSLLSARNADILGNNSTFDEKESSLKNAYREEVISDASSLLENEGYESAIVHLREAMEYLPEDEELKALIEEYTEFQPVRLYDLSYFSSGALNNGWVNEEANVDFLRIGTIKDNLGAEYFDGIKTAGNYYGTWESYKLDRAYKKMTGKIIIDNETKSSERSGYVKIFVDDLEVYSSPKMTKGSEPVDFEVDVTGVDVLTIKMLKDLSYIDSHFTLVECKFYK